MRTLQRTVVLAGLVAAGLLGLGSEEARGQVRRRRPVLGGYVLGRLRPSFDRAMPCEPMWYGEVCRPSDEYRLAFKGDTLETVVFTPPPRTDTVATDSPLARWNRTWRAWAVQRFGMPDSVRMEETHPELGSDETSLHAVWGWNNPAARWRAELVIRQKVWHLGSPLAYTTVYVSVQCQGEELDPGC